jgi:ABC-type Fe3+/spermidine/putrescine transport system ATPase subunit
MIQFEGAVWSDVQRDLFVAPRKRRVGFVSQDYALFPHLTAERHIYHGTHDLPVGLRHEQVARMVAWLGLEGLEKRLPHELSGRQQQRGGARKGGGVPTLLTQQALPGA